MFCVFVMTFRQYGLLLIVGGTKTAGVCHLTEHPHSAFCPTTCLFWFRMILKIKRRIIFKIRFSFDMTPCYVITRSEIDFVLFDKSTNRDSVIYQIP